MDRYSCLMCSYSTVLDHLLIKHVIRYHRNDPKFKVKCEIRGCGATFAKWRSFKQHVTRFHPQNAITLNFLNNDNENNNVNEIRPQNYVAGDNEGK